MSYPEMPPNGPLNGWVRLLGLVGVPGAISLYLVWWITTWVGAKLDRIIQLLEQIARAPRGALSRCSPGTTSCCSR